MFGDPLLYMCHDYINENKMKPESWTDLFEYARFIRTKNTLKERAINLAKARAGENNG
jgi:hypothetical protein